MKYKLIISNQKIYKEIELPDGLDKINIGTTKGCEVRLQREDFFEDFVVTLIKIKGKWTWNSSENIYISVDNIRKLWAKDLINGDDLKVYYTNTASILFDVYFYNDFELETQKYNRKIQLNSSSTVKIGTNPEADIVISSEFVEGELLQLILSEEGYLLEERKKDVGAYINGSKLQGKVLLKNHDFLSVAEYGFYYCNGELYCSEEKEIRLSTLQSDSAADSKTVLEYPKYNRSTRVKTLISDEKIEILDPPKKPEKPKNNIILSLLPTVGMAALTFVMYLTMKTSSGSFMIMSIGSMGLGIITTIIGMCNGVKEYKKEKKERVEKYQTYILEKEGEIQKLRETELQNLRDMYYSLEKDIEHIETFSGKLFDRLSEDEDFLYVYLGTGRLEALAEINYKRQENFNTEDKLSRIPEALYKKYKYLSDAPIVADCRQTSAVGVISRDEYKYGIFKNMLLDMVSRQYHTDINIFLLADEVQLEKVKWIRFLPHLYTGEARNIACDIQSRNNVFEYLYKELSRRAAEKTKKSIHLVVFVLKELGIKNHPISRFIENAKELNATFLFFEQELELLPLHCGEIIYIKEEGKGLLLQSEDKTKFKEFEYKTVPDAKVAELIRKLAPVYCEEISLESALRKNISLFELLSIYSVEDLDLQERWKASKVYETIAAPLGINSKDDIVYLDLHEKAHGPHGLVAGTTGSGKSEILQTYILSIITLFSPCDVGFMLIDFKGGGMVNQLKELPHLLGSITNIDGKQIERSLKSIRAELIKRQELFAQAEVNHIDKYIKLFKKGQVSIPLPHLVIIVDEFAEVKAEQPEFMKELISTARIGRSLGVHLILATQKPSGQVSEQIWSNSRFKLCLKVQTSEDSNEMLKSPLAAEIMEPGRAYFQVGNNEIFELFQSGYSGGPEKVNVDSKVKEFQITSVDYIGNKQVVFQQKQEKKKAARTQLEAVVEYVTDFCRTNLVTAADKICLPPLEVMIPYNEEFIKNEKKIEMPCGIGIYDDPDGQYQGLAKINASTENTMIIGSAQYGKTNLLQNIIRTLADTYSPKELNIYILDFASMVLKNFETLNHVGGVVTATEDEKLKNLFKYLRDQVGRRREILLSAGVSSFAAYKEAGKTDLPQIILIVDNLTALKELYLQEDDVLLELSREGLSVGISMIVANAQTSGMGYRYMANFSSKIALFNNDESEYANLFGNVKLRVEAIPGRCLVELNKNYYECQTFQAFVGEKEYERVQAIGDFIEKINSKYAGEQARLIPEIPEVLTSEYLEKQVLTKADSLVIGLDYETVSPVNVNCMQNTSLVLCGGEKSGKTNFIKYALYSLSKIYGNMEVYIADDYRKKLQNFSLNVQKQEYFLLSEQMEQAICDIEKRMEKRQQSMFLEENENTEEEAMIVLVINSLDIMESMSKNTECIEAYKNLVGRYKNMGIFIILGNFPNIMISSYDSPEMLKLGKGSGHMICFEDIEKVKAVDVPYEYIRKYKKKVSLGDAFYINENDVVKIKTPLLTN